MFGLPPPIPATSAPGKNLQALRLQRDMQGVLADNLRYSIPHNAINATICGAILSIHEPLGAIILWAAAHWLTAGLRLGVYFHSRQTLSDDCSSQPLFLALTALQGVLWGAAPLCLTPSGDPFSIAIITLMIAGMTAGATLSLMSHPLALALYVFPAASGLFVHYLAEPGLAMKSIALVLAFYIASILSVARRIRGFLVEVIRKKWAIKEKNAEIERKNGELYQLAHYDALTGAANRKFLDSNGQQLVNDELARNGVCAFIHIDLDHFKHINDTLGHHAGDELLRHTAARIRKTVRKRDILFRLGGDEFGLLLLDLSALDDARDIAEKLLCAIKAPLNVDGDIITCRASMGIAIAPIHGREIDELLTNSDIALQDAKTNGRATYAICDEDSQLAAQRRATIGDQLRVIVRQEDFDYAFQPIFDVRSGVLHAAEILLRFKSLPGQHHNTEEFIKIAESSGLIGDLGEALLGRGLAQAQQLFKELPTLKKVSINLSPTELRSGKIMSALLNALENGPLTTDRIQIEMLENAIVDRGSDLVIGNLRKIVDAGAAVVLDDFGTGYSSLSHLKDLPVSGVKIDKSFIRKICTNSQDSSIVRSIIVLCHSLGLTVTCEGVEDRDQYLLLRSFSSDYVQGFFFSAPLSGDEFIAKYKPSDEGCKIFPRGLAGACDDCDQICEEPSSAADGI